MLWVQGQDDLPAATTCNTSQTGWLLRRLRELGRVDASDQQLRVRHER